MPNILLAVSHRQQQVKSDCLPVCVQMVLDYLGQPTPYDQLTKLLRTQWFGTPSNNILLLQQIGLQVTLTEMPLDVVTDQLQKGLPVIAFVNTDDLPYWDESTDHAVIVVGIDDQFVYLNDPHFATAPQKVPHSAFELAQLRFDHRCATIQK